MANDTVGSIDVVATLAGVVTASKQHVAELEQYANSLEALYLASIKTLTEARKQLERDDSAFKAALQYRDVAALGSAIHARNAQREELAQ